MQGNRVLFDNKMENKSKRINAKEYLAIIHIIKAAFSISHKFYRYNLVVHPTYFSKLRTINLQ